LSYTLYYIITEIGIGRAKGD